MARLDLAIPIAGLVLGLGLACGGGGPNQAACEEFVAAYNKLECTHGGFTVKDRPGEPNPICTRYLDFGDCDMTAFFACLEERAECSEVAEPRSVLTAELDDCLPACAP